MGSISTVSSQTFKTYCFRAEGRKKRWRKRREEGGEESRQTKHLWWAETEVRIGGEEKVLAGKRWRDRRLLSGEVKVRAVVGWWWGPKRKMRPKEGGDSKGRKGGGKEGEKLRMSSGRTWKWASIIAVACSCSASNNFTFPSHSYGQLQTGMQTLFTGNPATAHTENKLNNVPGSPLLRTTSLRLPLTRLAKRTVCIYNRWCPYMEIHLSEDVLTAHSWRQKKKKKGLYSRGRKNHSTWWNWCLWFWQCWFHCFIVLFII